MIYPTAVGCLHIPHTTITLTAYVFINDDLADHLFGLAYGTKSLYENSCSFSLPKPSQHQAHQFIHHKTHAEIVLYASSAVFDNPTVKTLSKALRLGWLSNFPDLTPQDAQSKQSQSLTRHRTWPHHRLTFTRSVLSHAPFTETYFDLHPRAPVPHTTGHNLAECGCNIIVL
jgi:hypothetical protein